MNIRDLRKIEYFYPPVAVIMACLIIWVNSTPSPLALIFTFFLLPVPFLVLIYGLICLYFNGTIANLLNKSRSIVYIFSGGIYVVAAVCMPSWYGYLEDISKTRGDKILVEMKNYQEQHGSCPAQLSDLPKIDGVNYKPAILDSEFKVTDYQNICRVQFWSDTYWLCRKDIGDREWYCFD